MAASRQRAHVQVRQGWQVDEQQRAEVAWEAAYADQNIEHAFTGVLQRFAKPLGDTSHDILSIWNGQARHRRVLWLVTPLRKSMSELGGVLVTDVQFRTQC
jgi:hypothetical protein